MGFMDKFKKILFDEDVIEVPVDSDDLPERTPKKDKKVKEETKAGFIEYHGDEEVVDENPIKELVIPKEDKIVEETPKKTSIFGEEFKDDFKEDESINNEMDSFVKPNKEIPTRRRSYDDLELSFMDDDSDSKNVEVLNSYHGVKEFNNEKREIKDYRKMLSDESQDSNEKKPFKNTPVISPVWGILDKNYTPEEIVDKTDVINKINTGAMPRSYGPVSYNDQPLLDSKKKSKELKEDLVEINKSISEMINDEEIKIEENDIELEDNSVDLGVSTDEIEKEIIKEITPSLSFDEKIIEEDEYIDAEDDDLISTDDYDSYDSLANQDTPTHSIDEISNSIEEEKEEHTNIEDAFDNTDEYESIDNSVEEDNVVDFDAIVKKKEIEEDDENLDNTIETDLFNLIDSMYKDEEDV